MHIARATPTQGTPAPAVTPSSLEPPNTRTLTLTRPDDWHLHVRDGPGLASVVPHTARVFRQAIIMPNTVPPITTVPMAMDYRSRILDAARAVAPDSLFEPLVTMYLTSETSPSVIAEAQVRSWFYVWIFT